MQIVEWKKYIYTVDVETGDSYEYKIYFFASNVGATVGKWFLFCMSFSLNAEVWAWNTFQVPTILLIGMCPSTTQNPSTTWLSVELCVCVCVCVTDAV